MEVFASKLEVREAIAPTLSGLASLAPTGPFASVETNTTGRVKSPLLLHHQALLSLSTQALNAGAPEATVLTREDQEDHALTRSGHTMPAATTPLASVSPSSSTAVLSLPLLHPQAPTLPPTLLASPLSSVLGNNVEASGAIASTLDPPLLEVTALARLGKDMDVPLASPVCR